MARAATRDVDLDHAVARNRVHARALRWAESRPAIARFLGFMSSTPGEREFAAAVARWQHEQPGLAVDGILGPQTWRRMRGAVGPVPSIDVDRAVRQNQEFGRSLGWSGYASAVARLVGFTTTFPTQREVALGIARWQRARGNLLVDGILGPRTLAAMEAGLRQPAPPPRAQAETSPEAPEAFFTHIPPIPPASGPSRVPGAELGHEILTERAALRAGIPAGTSRMRALRAGVTRVDIGRTTTVGPIELPYELPLALLHSFEPGHQAEHFLRGGTDLCQPTATAHSQALNKLVSLHGQAMRAGPTAPGYEMLGEALHLIQDSFSHAHTERDWHNPPHPIIYIRFFARLISPFTWPPRRPGILRGSAPHEHEFPTDNRDSIFNPGGSLRHEARHAIRVSTVYLKMAERHLSRPTSPTNGPELRRFMARHLALSPSHHNPSRYHPGTCP